ncbi:MAG: cyclic nucleotide-binding domain-containing protein [Alphaproteobacteria bacterium]|jgi:CRP-like cAMP-binding protein|nr:cAMP-binding protein [Rhodospirillaceae bacterium]MDP6407151.1 cyclic nucleotide-binding domain-containing protein [Alphaproteobacteria bacterium]|tara:strand:- start:576 stop:968 length:393 start_codon:yes stop_codon:yes gene_type:complete
MASKPWEVSAFRRKRFSAGTVLFEEGDPGDEVFLITEGEVEIRRDTRSDSPRILARLAKGDVFGELALFDNAPRMATVVAATPTVCNIISRDEFQKRLQEMDPVMRGITTLLVRRVRRLTDAVVSSKKDS